MGDLAARTFNRFKDLPGSQHIASRNALRGAELIMLRSRPGRILEVGAGIGTMTSVLVDTVEPGAVVTVVEDDEFCLEQLPINLGAGMERVGVVASAAEVEGLFDFVIVDGSQVDAVVDRVAPRGIVLVEGDRRAQRQALTGSARVVACRGVRSMCRLVDDDDPWKLDSQIYEGGYTVMRFEPSRSDRAAYWLRDLWSSRSVTRRRRLRDLLDRGSRSSPPMTLKTGEKWSG